MIHECFHQFVTGLIHKRHSESVCFLFWCNLILSRHHRSFGYVLAQVPTRLSSKSLIILEIIIENHKIIILFDERMKSIIFLQEIDILETGSIIC